MATSYYRLVNGNFTLPVKLKHVRNIYNDVTDKEISSKNLPDGDLFRKEMVQVFKKSGSQKVIHRGVVPEEKIQLKMKKLLSFMNDSQHIPAIIRVAISHYYFVYIHPFYDGNGRTSRFISSMYLYEELGPVPAISLSQACHTFQKDYLNSFEITNSVMNRGEMNLFIDTFLTLIYDTLKQMLIELSEKNELLELAYEKIKNDEKLLECHDKSRDLLFILAQHHFFEFNKGLTIRELAEALELSQGTVRTIVKQLLDNSLINQDGIRPAYFSVTQHYFEY